MSFRFVKVSRFYDAFLHHYYRSNPELADKPFDQQFAHLINQGFSWSDFICRQLRALGAEATEIVSNAGPLQAAWARENGVSATGTELILEQIRRLDPEVIFLQDTISFTHEWHARLRKEIPGLKLLLGWRCSPYTEADIERFRDFDLLITCNPGIIEDVAPRGISAKLLQHGFEETLLSAVGRNNPFPEQELMFAGSLIQARDYHYGRLEFLRKLVEAGLPLEIRSEKTPFWKLLAKKSLGSVAGSLEALGLGGVIESSSLLTRAAQWKEIRLADPAMAVLSRRWNQPLYGMDLFRCMQNTRINLNFHIDSSGQYAGNARLFEATGVGSCLVTDHKKNLSELFEPDQEIVVYRSIEECIEKIRWLLAHPEKAREIGRAGQKRCLRDHSFRARAKTLHQLIVERL